MYETIGKQCHLKEKSPKKLMLKDFPHMQNLNHIGRGTGKNKETRSNVLHLFFLSV